MTKMIPDRPSSATKAALYLEANGERLPTFSEKAYRQWPDGSVLCMIDKHHSPAYRALVRVATRLKFGSSKDVRSDANLLIGTAYKLLAVAARTRYEYEICCIIGEALVSIEHDDAKRWLLQAVGASCAQFQPVEPIAALLEMGVKDPFAEVGL